MTIKTDLGYIEITTEVLAGIAGYAASLCFGVKGMTIRSMTDGLAHLLGRENQSRGVKVTEAPDGVSTCVLWTEDGKTHAYQIGGSISYSHLRTYFQNAVSYAERAQAQAAS